MGGQPALRFQQTDPGVRLAGGQFAGNGEAENAAARHRDVASGWRAVGPAHAGII